MSKESTGSLSVAAEDTGLVAAERPDDVAVQRVCTGGEMPIRRHEKQRNPEPGHAPSGAPEPGSPEPSADQRANAMLVTLEKLSNLSGG